MRESQTTHRANKRLLAGMRAHVRAQVSGHCEGAVAERTAEWLLAEVDGALVSPQTGRGVEAHGALGARVRTLAAVRSHVYLEPTERAERPRTLGTRVRLRAGVDARVDRQQRRVLEASSAVGADVRRGVRVRSLVVGARAVLGEALGAAVDAADVRPLACVRSHVRRQRRRRAEPATAVAAHARPSVLRLGGGGPDGGGSSSSSRGGGVDVGRGVRAALVHSQERRECKLRSARSTDVTSRRLTTRVGRLSPVRSLMSRQHAGVLEALATNTARHCDRRRRAVPLTMTCCQLVMASQAQLRSTDE